MSILPQSDPYSTKMEECLRLHGCWGWFLVLGIILMIVGAAAIGSAWLATLTSVMVFGIMLLAGGVVQVVNAFLARCWRGFLLHLLAGIIQIVVGLLMIEHPVGSAAAFTLVLAAAFMVGGLLRIIYAVIERFPDWGWVLLNGLITLILGVMIWREWPESSFWVIGLFVGIDLLFNGWSWVMLGLIVKNAAKAASPTR